MSGIKKEMISIIVPVYNVEKYITECLESIRKQTYKEIEVILVDDGSTDKSSEICDEFVKKDNRFNVIHTVNKGVASARNTGLKNISGEYIFFLDSDDLLEIFAIEKMIQTLKLYHADMVCGNEQWVNEEDSPIGESRAVNSDNVKVFDREEALRYFVNLEWGSWNKLYKRNIHENIEFPNYKIHEDEAIKFKLLERCSRVILINEKTYRYRQRQGSLTNTGDEGIKPDMFYSRLQNYKWLEENHPELTSEFIAKVCEDAIYNLDILCKIKNEEKVLDDIIKFFKDYKGCILLKKNACTKSQKLRVVLINMSSWKHWNNLYIKVYSRLKKL